MAEFPSYDLSDQAADLDFQPFNPKLAGFWPGL
jgi:hypothetical protein